MPIDEQMSHDERVRLLYVACTRAQDHLVVSLHRPDPQEAEPDGRRQAHQRRAADPGPRRPADRAARPSLRRPPTRRRRPRRSPAASAVPAPGADRADARRPTCRRSTSGGAGATTALAASRPPPHGGRDRPRPTTAGPTSWPTPGCTSGPATSTCRRGRRAATASAFGRAVHGVLQTIDLATGDDATAEAVAAQAAAEGVIGHEDHIRRAGRRGAGVADGARGRGAPPLARGVRRRPARRATARSRATSTCSTGGADGLVVVDYKTGPRRRRRRPRPAGRPLPRPGRVLRAGRRRRHGRAGGRRGLRVPHPDGSGRAAPARPRRCGGRRARPGRRPAATGW